ncbi:YadA-like family protein [Mycetohabitans rhizoxinica]|uniref:YadA family autotransporter adhesin n=1 Tax=Mycetohabitans rhizoxinica TaxID=412963 RepID=UPI0030D06D03
MLATPSRYLDRPQDFQFFDPGYLRFCTMGSSQDNYSPASSILNEYRFQTTWSRHIPFLFRMNSSARLHSEVLERTFFSHSISRLNINKGFQMSGFYYPRRATTYITPSARRSNSIALKLPNKIYALSIASTLIFSDDAIASFPSYEESHLESVMSKLLAPLNSSIKAVEKNLLHAMDVDNCNMNEKLKSLSTRHDDAVSKLKKQLLTQNEALIEKMDYIGSATENRIKSQTRILENKNPEFYQKIIQHSNDQTKSIKSLSQEIRNTKAILERLSFNSESLNNKVDNIPLKIQNQLNKHYETINDAIDDSIEITKNQLKDQEETLGNGLDKLEKRLRTTIKKEVQRINQGNWYEEVKDKAAAESPATVSLQTEVAKANESGYPKLMMSSDKMRPEPELTNAGSPLALTLLDEGGHRAAAQGSKGVYSDPTLANQSGPSRPTLPNRAKLSELALVEPGGPSQPALPNRAKPSEPVPVDQGEPSEPALPNRAKLSEPALVDPGGPSQPALLDRAKLSEPVPVNQGEPSEPALPNRAKRSELALVDQGGPPEPAPMDKSELIEPMPAGDVSAARHPLPDSGGHPKPMLADEVASDRHDISSCNRPGECGGGSARERLRELIGADLPSLVAEKLHIHVDETRVSVGEPGHERRITDVARGTQLTDAVNKAQMDEAVAQVDRNASAGTAAAMAVAGLPQPTLPGKSLMTFAGATYRGQYGVALGISHVTPNNRWVLKFAANANGRGYVGMVAAGGFQW